MCKHWHWNFFPFHSLTSGGCWVYTLMEMAAWNRSNLRRRMSRALKEISRRDCHCDCYVKAYTNIKTKTRVLSSKFFFFYHYSKCLQIFHYFCNHRTKAARVIVWWNFFIKLDFHRRAVKNSTAVCCFLPASKKEEKTLCVCAWE